MGNIHIKEIDQIKDDSPMKDSIIEHDSRGSSSEMKSTVVEIDNPVSEVTIAVEDEKGVDAALNKAETMAPEKTFRVVLLILEPQMDFYADTDDDTAQHESSADRLASFIDRNRSSIDEIVVALDSHQVSKETILVPTAVLASHQYRNVTPTTGHQYHQQLFLGQQARRASFCGYTDQHAGPTGRALEASQGG